MCILWLAQAAQPKTNQASPEGGLFSLLLISALLLIGMLMLIGLIVAMVVNIFMQSDALTFAISVIGVLIFAGLTAYDTQRLKLEYDYVAGNAAAMSRTTLMGALSLYLNFINMFMMLLNLLGSRE